MTFQVMLAVLYFFPLFIFWFADTVDVRCAKLLVANYTQIKKIVDAEKRELDQQLKEEGDSLEGSFVQAAMQLLMVNNTVLCIIVILN